MRLLWALVYDLFLFLFALLLLPLRALRRRTGWLVVEVSGDPGWRAPVRSLWRLGRRRRRRPLGIASVKELVDALQKAERDPKLRGIVVKVEGFQGSGARLDAVSAALKGLREKGKEVVCYGRAVSMREYALMACGGRVFLAPGGRLDLKGYAAELYVLGETLFKLGVRAHFLRRAEHKTAPELFTDRQVSPAQRETTQALLEDLFEATVTSIALGRGKTEDEVRRWIDEGPYTATEALAKGLIDGIADGEELQKLLAEPGEDEARLTPVSAYRGPSLLLWPRYQRPLRRPRVGVVRIEGVIKLGESAQLPFMPRAAGSDTVVQALRRARDDKSLRAVVLSIDSRGGSSLASELILRAVRRLAEKKPVVAFLDRVAASGGYMAAVGAPVIVATPNSITGSIGVFGGKFEISGLLDKLGVGRAVVKLGKNAALESAFSPFSDEERASMDREIEETYRDFIKVVAEGRKRPVEQIEPLAGGRVYTGRRAVHAGLVDLTGGFEDAVAKAAELAQIKGQPDLVAVDVPARSLSALSGLRGLSDALQALLPLAEERVFAFEESGIRIRPEP